MRVYEAPVRLGLPVIVVVATLVSIPSAQARPADEAAATTLTRADIKEMRGTDLLSNGFVLPFAAHVTHPGEFGIPYETVRFPNRAGMSLVGWFLDRKDTDRTILVCMGNTGNMSYMMFYARMLFVAGFDVLLFDYQGFGASEGTASVLSIAGDAEAAWKYLRETRKLAPDRIGVLGISLGSVLALMVSSRDGETPRAVAIEDVFRPSDFLEPIRHMAKDNFALRAGLMMAERTVVPAIDPMKNLARIGCPTLLIHGENDWLLPPSGTIACSTAAAGPARVWLVPEVGHAPETLVAVDREYEHQLTGFFEDAFSEGPFEVTQASFDVLSVQGSVSAGSDIARLSAEVRVAVEGAKEGAPVLVMLSNDEGGIAHARVYPNAPAKARTLTTDFVPSRADAIVYGHVVDNGDGTWFEDLSDYAQDYRAWRDAEQQIQLRAMTNDVGTTRVGKQDLDVRVCSPADWEWLESRLPDAASVDERIRPQWATLLGYAAIGHPDEARRVAISRRMLEFLPNDPLRYYGLGNARLSVGFESRSVAHGCRIAAAAAAREGDFEEARRCVGLYLDLLPLSFDPGIDREGVAAIDSVADLNF